MKVILAITLIMVLLLLGCSAPLEQATGDITLPEAVSPPQDEEQSTPMEIEEKPCISEIEEAEQSYTLKATPSPSSPEQIEETQIVLQGQPPSDRTWISPGKVQVGNFYPGARAEWNLTINNGEGEARQFKISYTYPHRVAEGYSFPPPEASSWTIIADDTPVIAPRTQRDVLIILEMPKDAEAPEKWEFWISVKDITQTGMVQTELASRWLINMRT